MMPCSPFPRKGSEMSMEKGTTTRLATVLILFLVLATGSVLGIAADRFFYAGVRDADARGDGVAVEGAGEGGSEGAGEAGVSSRQRGLIVEQVGLSEDQKARIDSIVGDYRQRMRELQDELQVELREAYTPKYRALLEETRSEIKGVLSPDQQVAYDSLLVEHDRRREQRQTRDSLTGPSGQGSE